VRSSSTLTTKRRPDGTTTTGFTETVSAMVDHFIPADHGSTDTDYNTLSRARNKTHVTTKDDKLFTTAEVRDAIYAMKRNKAPCEEGITSEILQHAYEFLPKSTTAIYKGCLGTACVPKIRKREKLRPIVKSGKETCEYMTIYRPISLLNTAPKVLEKLLISRIKLHAYSNNLMNKYKYGFTPQTSMVNAVLA